MSKDYVTAVLDSYENKKALGELSPNLLNATPGNIREECLTVYRGSTLKGNEALRLFFGYSGADVNYLQILENSPAQKFKQMPKILNRKVSKPGLKYVELLAWLIDFSPRPITVYHLELKNKSTKKSETLVEQVQQNDEIVNKTEEIKNDIENIIGLPIQKNLAKQEEVNTRERNNENLEENKKDKNIGWKKWSLGIIAVFILMGFISFPRYMTWKEDHYEWLIFDTKKTPVVAIDWYMIRNFRKVTRKDTLTEYSIGKLWYLKENNNHDVFTMGGKHPVFNHRKLHLLSKRILDSIQTKVKLEKQKSKF